MNPRGFFFFLELNYIREVIFLFGSNATFSNFFAPLNIPNTAVPTLSVRRAESRRGGGGGLTADAFAAEDQRGWMSVCAVPGQNPHMFKRSLIEN